MYFYILWPSSIILPITFCLEMLSAYYVRCIYSNALQTTFDHGSKHYEPWSDCFILTAGPYCLRYRSPKYISRWETDDYWFNNRCYSKTCVKRPLSKRPEIGFQDQLSLNAGQKCCRKLQAFCNTWPSLSYHLSLRSLFCLFLSVCFTQVSLYFLFRWQCNYSCGTRLRSPTSSDHMYIDCNSEWWKNGFDDTWCTNTRDNKLGWTTHFWYATLQDYNTRSYSMSFFNRHIWLIHSPQTQSLNFELSVVWIKEIDQL